MWTLSHLELVDSPFQTKIFQKLIKAELSRNPTEKLSRMTSDKCKGCSVGLILTSSQCYISVLLLHIGGLSGQGFSIHFFGPDDARKKTWNCLVNLADWAALGTWVFPIKNVFIPFLSPQTNSFDSISVLFFWDRWEFPRVMALRAPE